MYKKIFISILFIIFLTTLSFSDAVIQEFRIKPGLNKVYLSWKVSVETDTKGYKIKRGFSRDHLSDIDFVESSQNPVPPGGTKDYSYTDKSIFKYNGRTFYYQIVVLDEQQNEVTSSEIRKVSAQISAVRHTWGSIKAMFR